MQTARLGDTHTHTQHGVSVFNCFYILWHLFKEQWGWEDSRILFGWSWVRNGTQHVKITLQNSVSTDAQGRQKWRKFGQTQVDLENGCKMCIVMCYLQNENSGFFFLFQLFWYMPFPDFKCLLWLHNKMVKLQFLKGHHVYSHGSVYCLE